MSKFNKKQLKRFGRLNFNYSKHVHMVLFNKLFRCNCGAYCQYYISLVRCLFDSVLQFEKKKGKQKCPMPICVFVNIVNNVPRSKYQLLKFSINKCLSICFLTVQCIKRSRSFIRHIHLIRSTLMPNYIPHAFQYIMPCYEFLWKQHFVFNTVLKPFNDIKEY